MASGIHHVTAIAGPAQRNYDFYTRQLGMRFIKKTVNYDDPGTYHLYWGDAKAQPGSVLTSFPWEHAAEGRVGPGETEETQFRIPEGSVGYWTHRLVDRGIAHEPPVKRFGETRIAFKDPDGMRLVLVAVPGADAEEGWAGDVPAEHAIRGFHGVTLVVAEGGPTGAVLTDVFGMTEVGREGALVRYSAGTIIGSVVDVHEVGGFPRGRMGRGTVHHVAFRASSDEEQAEMVAKLRANHRVAATEQKERNYFRSVYFREPGGVLFEIATDDPGFAVDEPADALGTSLKLPPWLEPERERIETVLPKLV